MFAVIKTGGKQYRASVEDVLRIEKLPEQAGDAVAFDTVLMLGEGDDVTVGAPLVEGASVKGEILRQFKGEKVINFKKRRRKHSSKRRKGHRQNLTEVRIVEILGADGASLAKAGAAAPQTAEAPAEPALETTEE